MVWFNIVWGWLQENWAGIVATSAVVITVQQFFQQRRHDRLSVKPNVSFNIGTTPLGVEFSISNSGLGPALNKGLNVFVRGNKLGEHWRWDQVLEGLELGRIEILDHRSLPRCLPDGQTVMLCRFASSNNVPHKQLLVDFGKSVQITFKHSSMYQERPQITEFDVRKQLATLD